MEDSVAAAAMVAQSSIVRYAIEFESGYVDVLAEMGKDAVSRAGRRPDSGDEESNKMAVAGPVAGG